MKKTRVIIVGREEVYIPIIIIKDYQYSINSMKKDIHIIHSRYLLLLYHQYDIATYLTYPMIRHYISLDY